jgi:glutaryl-CoA dehydrogenase
VTSDLSFQEVRLPDSALLPGSSGLKRALGCLSQARYGIAWGAVGAAMAVYDEALTYTKNRTQFGKPIASFQLVQRKLAWMVNEITKAQLLSLRLGRLKEDNKASPARVSLAKMNNVNIALEIARLGRDMLGANGTHDEYQVGRHMCNLEAVKTYEGTHDIHTLIIGEDVTGIPAFG